MKPSRFVVAAGLLSLVPGILRAQSFNLRDLLTDFLREGITLAPPPEGFPSHEAHFIGDDSPQFQAVERLNGQIADQLSSFPLASSAGGFTYTFDPALGVFVRSSDSFGPVFAERVDTIGKGRFNLGVNYSHFTFDQINDLELREGDLRLVFTHQDVNHDGSNEQFFFEGDVITARLSLKISTDITAVVFNYGITDRFDVGTAIPIVRVSIDARTDAAIDRLATGIVAPGIHRFQNGTDRETFSQSGSASGVGDVVLRAKYRLTAGTKCGIALGADFRLPTGDEKDLLGTGATEIKPYLIASAHLGAFSPHLNAGYAWAIHPSDGRHRPDEISYTGGFDWALSPRVTFAADFVGRTFVDAGVVTVEDHTFEANTNPTPGGPPNLVFATLPRLVVNPGDVNSYLGSVGLKINPVGNLLITVNGLFSLGGQGLKDKFTPLVGLDYSF
jgi:Putative MetA-pathway of phenol degradation